MLFKQLRDFKEHFKSDLEYFKRYKRRMEYEINRNKLQIENLQKPS